jgi:hypothetical protein
MIVVPDTNFFLHYKAPAEIPWADLTTASEVRVVVTRTIQSEIDKKKHELRGRAGERARKFSTLLHEIINAGTPTVVREGKPRVTVELFLRPKGFVPPLGLSDATWGDDAFVADVIALQAGETGLGCEVLLLSADGGPLITARQHGVRYRSLTTLDWALPEENDGKDKEIAALKGKVEELKRTGPAIDARFAIPQGRATIELHSTYYRPLGVATTEALLDELQRANPRVTDFGAPPQPEPTPNPSAGFDIASLADPFEWRPPYENAISAYRKEYDAWIGEARKLLLSLPQAMSVSERCAMLTFTMSNTGVEPARGVVVRFQASEGLTLRFPDREDTEAAIKVNDKPKEGAARMQFRGAPKPPEWTRVRQQRPVILRHGSDAASPLALSVQHHQTLSDRIAEDVRRRFDVVSEARRSLDAFSKSSPGLFSAYDHLRSDIYGSTSPALPLPPMIPRYDIQGRDPEVFYFKDGRRGQSAKLISFECDVFRHMSPDKEFCFEVCFQEGSTVAGGEVRVEVQAENLRNPYIGKVVVKRTTDDMDTLKEARIAIGLGPDSI